MLTLEDISAPKHIEAFDIMSVIVSPDRFLFSSLFFKTKFLHIAALNE